MFRKYKNVLYISKEYIFHKLYRKFQNLTNSPQNEFFESTQNDSNYTNLQSVTKLYNFYSKLG